MAATGSASKPLSNFRQARQTRRIPARRYVTYFGPQGLSLSRSLSLSLSLSRSLSLSPPPCGRERRWFDGRGRFSEGVVSARHTSWVSTQSLESTHAIG